jgi:biotin carboxyl carrier protein
MKMKSAVRTPREGIIASVAVREGQKVAYNDILVVFE